jgi:hypothetical protein
MPPAQARARVAAHAVLAERLAHAALSAFLATLEPKSVRIGILDSAGSKIGPLEQVLASHALIHAAAGAHFRAALERAAARLGLVASRIRARELDARAAATVGRPIESLRDDLKRIGHELGPPWTADQKAAALLAWVLLA